MTERSEMSKREKRVSVYTMIEHSPHSSPSLTLKFLRMHRLKYIPTCKVNSSQSSQKKKKKNRMTQFKR